jgi:nitroreductase/dihydropteridine reductase
MSLSLENLQEALNWRAAIKKYDKTKSVSEAQLNLILEAGRMAPSSVGLEPWKFIIIEDPETRAKLQAAAYGQTQVVDASYFVVLVAETNKNEVLESAIARVAKSAGLSADDSSLDGYRGLIQGTTSWMDPIAFANYAKQQVFIALGFMLEAAALAGIDANPMGGFDSEKFDEILNLKSRNLTSTVIMGVGVRDESDGYTKMPKFRKEMSEVVERV